MKYLADIQSSKRMNLYVSSGCFTSIYGVYMNIGGGCRLNHILQLRVCVKL